MELNKFPYARSCLAGAIALALLTGCGGGGGGSKGGSGGSDGGGSEPVTVSGAAAKGIIKNGVVKIYGVNGSGARGTVLAEGRTSSTDGTYSLSVSGYSGPVIVEITALEAADEGYPSLMVCDIPGTASCHDDVDDANDIGFGEDYRLGSGFALKAVVPGVSSGQSVTTNVTALTDLAASLAESNGVTADSVHLANTQVANLFSLSGDITRLPVVDVTDPAAMEALSGSTPQETESALKAALMSAALLSAAKADGNSIEAATTTVASGFVANNGQLVQNEASNTATTTLAEILAGAETLISDELSGVEALGQVATNITTEQNTAEAAPAGSTTSAQPSEDNLSDGFLKARALVQDLRDLTTAATFEEIQTGTTAFADNLDVASDLIGTDAGRAMEALSMVASAIAEAAQAEAGGPTYQAENGIVVSVATVEGVATYSFAGDVIVSDDLGDHTMAVELTGSGIFTISEEIEESAEGGSWSDVGTVAITVDFDLVGAVTNSVMSLQLKEGSNATVTGFDESWNDSGDESGWDENESLSIDNIGFTLNVRLEQLQSDVPVVFDGAFSAALAGFAYTGSSSEQAYNCEDVEGVMTCTGAFSGSSTQDFDTLTLSLNGEFSRGDEAFEAALTVNAINNGYQVVENDSWSHFWRDGEDSQDIYQESSSSETANAYVGVNFTLDMNTTLAGISDDVAVRLTGNRNAFRTGTASLRLQYEGKTIDANLALTGAASARAATLTITNNQGATLAITESNIDDENDALSGVITANNAQQATVAEENDIILIRYNGGYVESF